MEEKKDEETPKVETLLLRPPSPMVRSQSVEIELANTLLELSQQEQIKETWHVCCSKSEKSFIKFIVQVTMGLAVMLFCMLLIGFGDGEHDMICFTLLSGTLGLFFPHPTMTSGDGGSS